MDSSGKTRPIRVERLSPMAPSRRASGGVFQCRAIVPNGSPSTRKRGRLPVSSHCPQWLNTTRKRRRLTAVRPFALQAAVASGADRLGTIDLPKRRASNHRLILDFDHLATQYLNETSDQIRSHHFTNPLRL